MVGRIRTTDPTRFARIHPGQPSFLKSCIIPYMSRQTVEDVFAKVVRLPDGCWRWPGFHVGGVEPRASVLGKHWDVRKLSYATFIGERPAKVNIVNSCGNKWCVNPAHMHMGRRRHPDEDLAAERKRLISMRNIVNGCWNFTGSLTTGGYGIISHLGKTTAVHRLAYRLFVGPVQSRVPVLHVCDNPACFNPKHLRIGTQLENVLDMDAKGRRVSEKYKLSKQDVLDIRASTASTRSLAAQYGVRDFTISCIRRRISYRKIA